MNVFIPLFLKISLEEKLNVDRLSIQYPIRVQFTIIKKKMNKQQKPKFIGFVFCLKERATALLLAMFGIKRKPCKDPIGQYGPKTLENDK